MTASARLNASPLDVVRDLVCALEAEETRSNSGITLAAYESNMSRLCSSFLNGSLSGRYHLGVFGRREIDDREVTLSEGLMRLSLPAVSSLEEKALHACTILFGSTASDLRPLSGMHAMQCVVGSLTEPGDSIWSVDPRHGGHAATASLIARIGRVPQFLPWSDGTPAIEQVASKRRQSRPALVLIDLGATLFPLPLGDLRAALGPEIRIAYDASHVMGLIAGGAFPNPLRAGADVLFGNTHKSFPGPQKGMIHYADEGLANYSRERIGSAFVSSQHTGSTIGLYLTLIEMLHFGKAYAEAMIRNALDLSSALDTTGFPILRRCGVATASSTFWVIPPKGGNNDLCRRLMACGIFTNARNFEGRALIRIGTQYVTRQGMKSEAMKEIAHLCREAADPSTDKNLLRCEVGRFVKDYPRVEYSFDDSL